MILSEKRDAENEPRDIDVLYALGVAAVPIALILLQPDLGTVHGHREHRLRHHRGVRRAGALADRHPRRRRPRGLRRDPGRDPQAVPARPAHGVHRPDAEHARHRLQHPAGAHRDRLGRHVRHRPVPRPADPGPLRARRTRPTSSTPSRGRSSASSAPRSSSRCSASSSGGRSASRCAPRTCSAASSPPASPPGSRSRPSRTSA